MGIFCTGRGKPDDAVDGGFFLRGLGRFWEGLRVFESIAAHYSNIVRGGKTPQNRSGIVCMRAGITRRVAGRSGASTGCSGLCPLPNTSQALPNLPNSIARHPGVRLTAARCLPPVVGASPEAGLLATDKCSCKACVFYCSSTMAKLWAGSLSFTVLSLNSKSFMPGFCHLS